MHLEHSHFKFLNIELEVKTSSFSITGKPQLSSTCKLYKMSVCYYQ